MTKNSIWIVAGPTASGKSALAVALARAQDGVVINADSMQIYREIPILGAQPDAADFAAVPHLLYGHKSIVENYSAAAWVRDVVPVIQHIWAQGKQPILVGSSGLYLQALTDGLSPMPPVPPHIRKHVTDLYEMLGPHGFHAALRDVDPASAARLHATDRQRMIRAREVFEASRVPLSVWQNRPKQRALPDDIAWRSVVMLPPREILYANIDRRFDMMLDKGALDEARAVHALQPDAKLTGTRALGLPSLREYLDGHVTLDEAVAQAKAQSRQYAKRQYTWFHNQALPGALLRLADPVAEMKAAQAFVLDEK